MTGLHNHPVCLPQSILSSPQAVTLTLEIGGVGHTHTIFLSAVQVADIANNAAIVTVTSSFNGHTHDVTFLA